MKTKITKSGDTIIVTMQGRLDYETQEPLKNDLERLIDETKTDSVPMKIIFNLEQLEFVGSSGISAFVQTLKDFNKASAHRPRYCHVRSEFQKIIKAFDDESDFDIHENEDSARKSFSN
jgi:anti-anti-sigma factor